MSFLTIIRFRWVSLQLENLCDFERIKHEEDIHHELGRLPTTLKESYNVIFTRVKKSGSQSWLIANSALKWLLSAQRPLHTADFITAVAVDSNGQAIPLSKTQLLHICCNLVVVDAELDLFRFAHLSVREYVEGCDEYNDINIHSHALERCLALFVYDAASRTENKDCFTAYATIHWPSHYVRIEHNQLSGSMKAMLTQFLFNDVSVAFASWTSSAKRLYESMSWTDHKKKRMLLEALSMPPTAQFIASYLGLFSIVELLIASKNIDWNQRNENGHTSLHLGVLQNDERMVRLLLKKKINLEVANNEMMTALSLAAANGRRGVVELLVDAGASLKARDWINRTALHCAAVTGDTDGHQASVKTLLTHGADCSAKDRHGMTALWLAAKHEHKKVFELLVKAEADSNAADKSETPIISKLLQLESYSRNEHSVAALLSKIKGGDNIQDEDGQPSSWCAIHRRNVVKLLVENGADLRSVDKSKNRTLLHYTALAFDADTMQLLLDKGADIHAQDKTGLTVLHIAAMSGHYRAVEILLNAGTTVRSTNSEHENINLCNESGEVDKLTPDLYLKEFEVTPLHLAIFHAHHRIVKLLLSKVGTVDVNEFAEDENLHPDWMRVEEVSKELLREGMNLNFSSSKMTLAVAASFGKLGIMRKLLDNDAKTDARSELKEYALLEAAYAGHEKATEMLLEYGANVNFKKGGCSRTALHWAAKGGHEVIAKILLSNGAEVDLKDKDGNTALCLADISGHIRTITLLIERGANINSRDLEGGTPLHLAILKKNEKVIEILLEKDADTEILDKWGDTALHIAAKNGYVEGHEAVVQLLLEKGADINEQGGQYDNALQEASLRGHEAVVQLLLEKGADVNEQGGEYGNALQAASWGGHEAVVQLLLEKGADVNAQGGEYGNALQAASWGGHEAVVQLLLEKGADVNAQGGEYGNALQAASWGGPRRWCSCCWRRGRTSTSRVESTATRCGRHRGEVTRRWCSCCWRRGWTSTHRTKCTATRCRRHRRKVTRRWCSCCWRRGRTSTCRAESTATRCRRHRGKVTRRWCSCCWRRGRISTRWMRKEKQRCKKLNPEVWRSWSFYC